MMVILAIIFSIVLLTGGVLTIGLGIQFSRGKIELKNYSIVSTYVCLGFIVICQAIEIIIKIIIKVV